MNQKQYEERIDELEQEFTEAVVKCYNFLKMESTVPESEMIAVLQYGLAKIIEERK